MMKIPYYPGCTLNTYAKHFGDSAKESAIALGFEMEELTEWNCCGAAFPLAPDNVMGLTAPTKVLANARKAGDTVTTLCSVCYNVLKRTNKVVQGDKERRETINGFMEESYDGSLSVVHYLEILRDRVGFDNVKKAVKRPLKGLKLGAYYGCMLLRPFEDVGIDNHESPVIMENLFKALGAEAIDFPNKIECCGAHLAAGGKEGNEVVKRLSACVMRSAVGSGAEAIITSCPLCQYNLEESQGNVALEAPGYKPVPIVYFTQILGLALGQLEETLGFEKNLYDIRPLLKKAGV
jgi:heterodisulfide reductase subunit B